MPRGQYPRKKSAVCLRGHDTTAPKNASRTCRECSNIAKDRERRYRVALLSVYKHAAGCADCGYRAHAQALQFDHVRGEKCFDISKNVKLRWASIEAEMAKCDVVCANCHAVRTASRLVANAPR